MRRRAFIALGLLGCGDVAVSRRFAAAGLMRRGRGLGRGANTARGATWYVDSVAGDDNDDGRSDARPFKTLAKVKTVTASGDVVLLAKGGHWREELAGLPAAVTVRSYGAGNRPIIDGADSAANASFTKTAGQTNVYEIPWAHEFGDEYLNGENVAHRAWEDGSMLRRVVSLAACDSTPGSFYAAAPTTGTDTVYVHASNSSSVIANGKTYELTRRTWAVQLRQFRNHAHVHGLQGQRNSHAAGGLAVDGVLSGSVAVDGRVHSVFVRGLCEDTDALRIEPEDQIGAATMFITFDAAGGGTSEEGRNCVFRRCRALAETGTLSPAGGSNPTHTIGFFGHSTGGLQFGTVSYEDCHAENVLTGFGFERADVTAYYKCTTDNVRFGHASFADTVVVLGGSNALSQVDSELFHWPGTDAILPSTIIARGVRCYKTGGGTGPFRIKIAATQVEISRCTFAGDSSGGIPWLENGVFTFFENIIYGVNNQLMLRLGNDVNTPSLDADDNVYWNAGAAGATFQTQPPLTNHLTLAAWRTATGQDANSIAADPLFAGDPALGNFTVQVASPANALHAGADYEGEDNDAILQEYRAQYMDGITL